MQNNLKNFLWDWKEGLSDKQVFSHHLLLPISFGGLHLSPRTINSSYIGKIVCVEGIVNKCKIEKWCNGNDMKDFRFINSTESNTKCAFLSDDEEIYGTSICGYDIHGSISNFVGLSNKGTRNYWRGESFSLSLMTVG